MAEILVRGEAEVRAMPDRATVRITVDGEGDSRESAYKAAAEPARAVDAVLDENEGALDRVTTAALLVQPKVRYRKGEQIRTGWQAARTTVVEIKDLTRVGDLLSKVAAAGGSIAGPTWELDGAHPAHDEARQSAARDARQRAEAYASALGLSIAGISWVSEPGLRTGGSDGPSMRMFAAAGGRACGAAPNDDEPIDVTPEEITVASQVEVAFLIAE